MWQQDRRKRIRPRLPHGAGLAQSHKVLERRPSLIVLWRASHAGTAVIAGVLAAIPGAALSGLAIGLADWLYGRSAMFTWRQIATLALPAGGSAGEVMVVALGMHMVASVFLGVLWGILVAFTAHHLSPLAGSLWGALYGVVIWFLAFFLILPWWLPDLVLETPARIAIAWHVVYGATLGGLFHYLRPRERARHEPFSWAGPSPRT